MIHIELHEGELKELIRRSLGTGHHIQVAFGPSGVALAIDEAEDRIRHWAINELAKIRRTHADTTT